MTIPEKETKHCHEKTRIKWWDSPVSGVLLLKFPLAVVKRTHLTRFKPTWNAVKVEGVLKRHNNIRMIDFVDHSENTNLFLNLRCRLPTQRCTPRSSQTLGSLGIQCLYFGKIWMKNCLILLFSSVKYSHKSMMWFRQIAQLSTTISGTKKTT